MNFPYHYKNALTMKIICGDTSDKIDGIKGVQEKTLMTHFPILTERYVTVKEICEMADKINEERINKKLKPLAALRNITENIERLKLNYQLINLSKPFLNEEAINALDQLEQPLIDENRGSSNLYKLMEQDDFLSLYSNWGRFVEYVEPFYGVIAREKEMYKTYQKNSKKISN